MKNISTLTKSIFAVTLTIFILMQCSQKQENQTFFDVSSLDKSITPTSNFFRYVNGKWVDKTEIPADQTTWGGFVELHNKNQKKLQTILEDLQKNYDKLTDVDEKKLAAFFISGIDTTTIDSKGFEPIKAQLTAIDNIQNAEQLIDYATKTEQEGFGFLFGYDVSPDMKNSKMNILNFYQSGLNLPNREYYLNERNAEIKKEYQKYITNLFVLVGQEKSDAEKIASEVLDLETTIARSHKKDEDLRIPEENYNKVNRESLKKLVPTLDWDKVLGNIGVVTDEINIGQPAYYKALGELVKKSNIQVWKNKIKLDLMNSSAAHLSKEFRQTRFDFFNTKLRGQKEEKPRWEIVTNMINGTIGELLGKIYVKKHFSENAKKRMDQLITHLFVAYKKHIEELTWMSNETKQKAFVKLNSFIRKIGYPDKWKDYANVQPKADDYFGNVLQARKQLLKEAQEKLGKPVDKTEWFMSPSTVNAYYNPSFNEIVFPAAILQFPFFDENADDAINYGGIGMVIGHEITHGFDDQGKEFDAEGNLVNWWTKEDEQAFNERAKKIEEQYNSYSIAEGFNVNGKNTLGENIADLGGLVIAYDAFQMTEQAQKALPIDGLTPNQRFFMSYAQIWRSKSRPETEKMMINVDPHSPAIFRVNGPLTHFTPFYEVFGEDPNSPYYKPLAERVSIW